MKILPLLVLSCLLASCDTKRVYEKNTDLNNKVWEVANRVEFSFTIRDYKKNYNVYYLIRNSLDFPFSRLFVEYTLQNEKGTHLKKKLDAQYLFNQKTGEPYGKSGLGSVFSHKFALLKDYNFKQPGNYKVRLEQFNRSDTLQGILSVGVRVEYAE